LVSILHILKHLITFIFRNLFPVKGTEESGGGSSNLILKIHFSDSDFACSQVGENNGNYGHSCAAEDMCQVSRKVTCCEELQ
jgi:hypothetical protein